jgi:hypothetical protein
MVRKNAFCGFLCTANLAPGANPRTSGANPTIMSYIATVEKFASQLIAQRYFRMKITFP